MENGQGAFLILDKITVGEVQNYKVGYEIPLEQSTTIGRMSIEPDFKKPDIKIMGDQYISRGDHHAQIYFDTSLNSFIVRDNGSKYGTFLNKALLEKHQPYPLNDLDGIALARINGEFRVMFTFRTTHVTPNPLGGEKNSGQHNVKGLYILEHARRLYIDGIEIELTPQEWEVLSILYRHRGNVCMKDTISYEGWTVRGKDDATDELIARYISNLRKKIEGETKNFKYIINRSGGYLLNI